VYTSLRLFAVARWFSTCNDCLSSFDPRLLPLPLSTMQFYLSQNHLANASIIQVTTIAVKCVMVFIEIFAVVQIQKQGCRIFVSCVPLYLLNKLRSGFWSHSIYCLITIRRLQHIGQIMGPENAPPPERPGGPVAKHLVRERVQGGL